MSQYVTPPEKAAKIGRSISAGPGTHEGVSAQLKAGEILVGVYEGFHLCAPLLPSQSEFIHFEGQYHAGMFIRRWLYACEPEALRGFIQ
jgi:hypothetical protein